MAVETLDYYVIKALDFFKSSDYKLTLPESGRSLVVGSQNGYWTGRILYRFAGRCFSHAEEVLAQQEIDGGSFDDVTVVSATGSRNVVPIVGYALGKGLKVNLIACRKGSEVMKKFGGKVNEILVPTYEEPMTVNTVTYGNMIRGVTHEDAAGIKKVVDSLPSIPRSGKFVFLFPDEMLEVSRMVNWKMQEIFGRRVGAMAANITNFMHGGAVCNDGEVFVNIGVENKLDFDGCESIDVDVPGGFGPLGYLMVGYALIGKQQGDFFQNSIENYKKRSSGWNWRSPVK